MHRLVCAAFHGPCPNDTYTCDHINRDSSDNRASNLRWASKSEQKCNQTTEPRSVQGLKPIFLRKVGDEEWTWYASAGEAVRKTPLTNLDAMLKEGKSHLGYEAKYAPPLEAQESLPAANGLPAEEWKDVGPGRRVSNRGRAQQWLRNGTNWGHVFTPKPYDYGKGLHYVQFNGKHFHRVVWEAFGTPLREGETIDHKDRDIGNNCIVNLKAASKSEQAKNRTLKPLEQRQNSLKIPVYGRDPDTNEWVWFDSAKSAERDWRRLVRRANLQRQKASTPRVGVQIRVD